MGDDVHAAQSNRRAHRIIFARDVVAVVGLDYYFQRYLRLDEKEKTEKIKIPQTQKQSAKKMRHTAPKPVSNRNCSEIT